MTTQSGMGVGNVLESDCPWVKSASKTLFSLSVKKNNKKTGNLGAFEIFPWCENGHRCKRRWDFLVRENYRKIPFLFAWKHFLSPPSENIEGKFAGNHDDIVQKRHAHNSERHGQRCRQFRAGLHSKLWRFCCVTCVVWWMHSFAKKKKNQTIKNVWCVVLPPGPPNALPP